MPRLESLAYASRRLEALTDEEGPVHLVRVDIAAEVIGPRTGRREYFLPRVLAVERAADHADEDQRQRHEREDENLPGSEHLNPHLNATSGQRRQAGGPDARRTPAARCGPRAARRSCAPAAVTTSSTPLNSPPRGRRRRSWGRTGS